LVILTIIISGKIIRKNINRFLKNKLIIIAKVIKVIIKIIIKIKIKMKKEKIKI